MRVRVPPAAPLKPKKSFIFHICGKTIPLLIHNGEFITNDKDPRIQAKTLYQDRAWLFSKKYSPSKNQEERQPILCQAGGYDTAKTFIPCLADFGFPSIISPNEMYEKIYAFLGWLKNNPEIPNNQTDVEKIIAHGFDKRTSFRPKIK